MDVFRLLDVLRLHFFVVSAEVADALERNRPGPMTLEEHARFAKGLC